MTTAARLGVDIVARDGTAQAFMAATSRIERYGAVAANFLKGFAVGFGATQVLRGLDATIDRMDRIHNSSKRLGIGAEELSKLGYAAQLSELPFETLEANTNKLNRNLAAIAGGGGGEAAKAFKAMGLSATDAVGHVKSADAVMAELAGKFSRYEDGANKAALATAIFGKSGTDMIPFLNEGQGAITDMTAEAERFGLVISQNAASNAAIFNDNLDRMAGYAQGITQQVMSQFLPAINDLADSFLDVADGGAAATAIIDGINYVLVLGQKYMAYMSTQALTLSRYFVALGESLSSLMSGDFSGATDAFGRASADVAKYWEITELKLLAAETVVNRMGKGSLEDFQRKSRTVFDAPSYDRGGGRSKGGGGRKTDLRKIDEMAGEAERIFESLRTPLEAYAATVARLQLLHDKGYLSAETYNRGVASAFTDYVNAEGALHSYTDAVEEYGSVAQNVMERIQGTVPDMLADIATNATSLKGVLGDLKDGFSDMARSFMADAVRMAANRWLQMFFAPQGLYENGGTGTNWLTALFGGFRAKGGSVSPGKGYVVGERGPEWFSPGTSGTIVPNHKLGMDPGSFRGGTRNGVVINDMRGAHAPPVQRSTDAEGRDVFTIMDEIDRRNTRIMRKTLKQGYGIGPSMVQR